MKFTAFLIFFTGTLASAAAPKAAPPPASFEIEVGHRPLTNISFEYQTIDGDLVCVITRRLDGHTVRQKAAPAALCGRYFSSLQKVTARLKNQRTSGGACGQPFVIYVYVKPKAPALDSYCLDTADRPSRDRFVAWWKKVSR